MNKNTRTITDFSKKEYKQWAQNKNFQQIATVFGTKPTSNKVLYTVFTNNVTSWAKVEDTSSATSLKTQYLGGANNIDNVIVNAAAVYCGKNNMSVLDTKGDFGARLDNTAGAGRYIFVRKGKMFDSLFNKDDLNILPQYSFEGNLIEYRFFTFNLPMLLVNGSSGTGSGHGQNIFSRNPKELHSVLLDHLQNGTKIKTPNPWFINYSGSVHQGENSLQWLFKGAIERRTQTQTYVTEIPVDVSKTSYMKKLDVLVDKKIISDYDDLCDPKKDKILFSIKHSREFGTKTDDEIMDILKLTSKDTENFTIIDEDNKIRIFNSADEVFEYYVELKLKYTSLRKDFMVEKIKDEIKEIESKIAFIDSVINGSIVVNNKKKDEIVSSIKEIKTIIEIESSYDYLLRMPIYSLTVEKIQDLQNILKQKNEKLSELLNKSAKEMFIDDIKDIKFSDLY